MRELSSELTVEIKAFYLSRSIDKSDRELYAKSKFSTSQDWLIRLLMQRCVNEVNN